MINLPDNSTPTFRRHLYFFLSVCLQKHFPEDTYFLFTSVYLQKVFAPLISTLIFKFNTLFDEQNFQE